MKPPPPLMLFPDCPVGPCANPVPDPAEPCAECLAAFGPLIRRRAQDGP